MAHNADLLTALTTQQAAFTTPDGINALNALVNAGNEPNNFRKAIIDHKVFWSGLGGGLAAINAAAYPANNNVAFFNENGDGVGAANNNMAVLLKHIAENRVTLGLKNASDALLLNIINAPDRPTRRQKFAEPAGKTVFSNLTAIPNLPWVPANQNIIDDAAVDRILLEAKRTLLLRKIEACNAQADIARINALVTAVTAGANPAYGNAATALGVPHMVFADNTAAITRAAIKKGLSLEISVMTDVDVLNHGFATLNEANAANFRGRFPASVFAAQLNNGDVDEIKGQLGTHFLTIQLASDAALTGNDLTAIAVEADPVRLAALLKTHHSLIDHANGGTGAYIDHVVTTPHAIPALRQAAAAHALSLSIAQCDDIATLDALIKAKTAKEIKSAVANSDSLGFKGNNNFLDALDATSLANLKDIIAAAHVRKSISTAKNPDHLKELINLATFPTKYNQHFGSGLSTLQTQALTAYFAQPDNVLKAREEALLNFAKAKLSDTALLDDAALNRLVVAGAANQVLPEAKTLLGLGVGDTTADDLIAAHNAGVGHKFRAYAAAEEVFRQKKALDLSVNSAQLIGAINNLGAGAPAITNDQRPLLAILLPQEKHALQARLAEVLATNYKIAPATPLVNLTNLAKAKNLIEFNQALTSIGVNNQAWVNSETMITVQKAACLSAIKMQLATVSQFGDKAHPELVKLISTLPVEKQKSLLAQPETLKALARTQDKNEVKRLVDDYSINVDALIAENGRLAVIATIQNSQVAEILANLQPPISLTRQQRNNINAAISAPNALDALNYVATVITIAAETGPNRAGVFAAFGLNAIANNAMQVATKAQKDHNAQLELLAADPNLNPSEKAVMKLCLTLKKGGVLTVPAALPLPMPRAPLAASEFTDFYNDFQASNSAEEFINKANTPPPAGRSYKARLDPSWERQLTAQTFKEIKRTLSKQKFLDNAAYAANLDTQKAKTAAMAKTFTEIKSKSSKVLTDLNNLATVETIEWLNPAFQAAAKQNAREMFDHFQTLADGCDTIVTQFRHQRDALTDEYNSLPTVPEANALPKKQKQAIEKRRAELLTQYKEVVADLTLYEGVQKTLKGRDDIDPNANPLLHQGILKTLRDIKEGNTDIQFLPFNSKIEPFPIAAKAAHLERTYVGGTAAGIPTTVTTPGMKAVNYTSAPMVKEGEFHQHTISQPTAAGGVIDSYFIEERNPAKNLVGEIDSSGKIGYSPSITLTVNRFPKRQPGGTVPPTVTDAELMNAQIKYSMALASQALAGLASAPTAEKPIVIRGDDPEELEHLWTAFYTFGQIDPNMKFDESAIQVLSTAFNPDEQKRKWTDPKRLVPGSSPLNDNSLYTKNYKDNTNVKFYAKGLLEANKNKVEGRDELIESAKASSNFFKSELTTMKKVEQDNLARGSTPTLGGS